MRHAGFESSIQDMGVSAAIDADAKRAEEQAAWALEKAEQQAAIRKGRAGLATTCAYLVRDFFEHGTLAISMSETLDEPS